VTRPINRRTGFAQDQLTIRQRLAHELIERKQEIPAILDALVNAAKEGNVPAARELGGWYDQGLGRPEQAQPSVAGADETTAYDERSPEERALLRAEMMRKIARMEAELEARAADAEEVPVALGTPSPAIARDS
jgi:hypothetical protein